MNHSIILVASLLSCGLAHAADAPEQKVVAEPAAVQSIAPKVAAVVTSQPQKEVYYISHFRSWHADPVTYSSTTVPVWKPGVEDLFPGCGNLQLLFRS